MLTKERHRSALSGNNLKRYLKSSPNVGRLSWQSYAADVPTYVNVLQDLSVPGKLCCHGLRAKA